MKWFEPNFNAYSYVKDTVAADAVWAAKGQPVFGKSPKKTGDDDDDVVENDHDPHFEPVVPLPDLVEVSS